MSNNDIWRNKEYSCAKKRFSIQNYQIIMGTLTRVKYKKTQVNSRYTKWVLYGGISKWPAKTSKKLISMCQGSKTVKARLLMIAMAATNG
jgi:hypothetical protein